MKHLFWQFCNGLRNAERVLRNYKATVVVLLWTFAFYFMSNSFNLIERVEKT